MVTARPYPTNNLHRPGFPWPLIFIALLAAVIYTAHAVKAHGADAENIRDCLNERGPDVTYQSASPYQQNKFYLGCQLEDGRWGLQILVRAKDGSWREKTSFIVKDGSWNRFVEYVSARARLWTGGGL